MFLRTIYLPSFPNPFSNTTLCRSTSNPNYPFSYKLNTDYDNQMAISVLFNLNTAYNDQLIHAVRERSTVSRFAIQQEMTHILWRPFQVWKMTIHLQVTEPDSRTYHIRNLKIKSLKITSFLIWPNLFSMVWATNVCDTWIPVSDEPSTNRIYRTNVTVMPLKCSPKLYYKHTR